MTFTIRTIQAADLDQVRAIATASPEAPQWPSGIYDSYLSTAVQPPICRTALVVERDGQVIAFAAATLLLDGEQNLCQLDSMAVLPDTRRHGIGAALLEEIFAWAARCGALHFSLEVRASNAPALALYQRFGLCAEGCRPRYYAHPEEDALLLGTSITLGDPPGLFHRKSG